MRYYTGQRFIGQVAGSRHLFTTVEQYAGGPVEVKADTGARFPTAVLQAMVEAGAAAPDHSCLGDPMGEHTPAYLLAERCARCQQLSGADEPGGLASLVAIGAGR